MVAYILTNNQAIILILFIFKFSGSSFWLLPCYFAACKKLSSWNKYCTFQEHILNLVTEDLVSWAQNYKTICQPRLEILKVYLNLNPSKNPLVQVGVW